MYFSHVVVHYLRGDTSGATALSGTHLRNKQRWRGLWQFIPKMHFILLNELMVKVIQKTCMTQAIFLQTKIHLRSSTNFNTWCFSSGWDIIYETDKPSSALHQQIKRYNFKKIDLYGPYVHILILLQQYLRLLARRNK